MILGFSKVLLLQGRLGGGFAVPPLSFQLLLSWSFLGDHPLARVGRVGGRRKATNTLCEVKVLRVSWGQVVVGKWIPCLKLTETHLKMGKNPIRKGCRWCSLPLPPIFHPLWLLVNFRECYLKKVLGALPAWADFDRIRITHWKNNFLRFFDLMNF